MLQHIRHLLVALMVTLLASLSGEAKAQSAEATEGEAYNVASYVLFAGDAQREAYEIDSLFFLRALPIIFPVSRTVINPNNVGLQHFLRAALPLLRAEGVHNARIRIRSAASPEGPLWFNKRLCRGRRDALLRIFKANGVDPSELQIDVVDEEYELLAFRMRQAGDPEAVVITQLVNEYINNPVVLKYKLTHYKHGNVWRRMLRDYYPELRASRFMIIFPENEAKDLQRLGIRPLQAEPVDLAGYQVPMPDTLPAVRELPAPAPLFTPLPFDSLLIRPELLAIRSNLLYDAWYQPQFGWAPGMDVQLEYFPLDGHMTYNAGFTFHNHRHWADYQFFQIRDIELEARWYFRPDAVFAGPYAGLDLHGSWYGIGFSKTKGWEGEGGGAGLTFGWTWYLTDDHRWRFEADAGLGYFLTRYDPYVYGNTLTGLEDGKYYYAYYGDIALFRKRNHQFRWIGPTQAGLHLTYILLYRRLQQRGAGFHRTEVLNPTEGSTLLQEGDDR